MKIKTKPTNTPGTKKGSHTIAPTGQRQVANATPITSAADVIEKIAELIAAPWPALNAGKNSSQVRPLEHKSVRGSPTDRNAAPTAKPPPTQNQPSPSCRRKTPAKTAPSSRGQEISRRRSQKSRSRGASTNGQLMARAAPRFKLLLNSTQTSTGNTFTCKIAGTAKLFSASTNVSTADCASALPASGTSRRCISGQPVICGSDSSWPGSSRCHAPRINNSEIGQNISDSTHTVPPSE